MPDSALHQHNENFLHNLDDTDALILNAQYINTHYATTSAQAIAEAVPRKRLSIIPLSE